MVLAVWLAACPVHADMIPSGVDLWFSTSTPTISFKNGLRYLGPGSVMSVSGNVIATNQQLLAGFNPKFGFPMDRGLDALSIVGTEQDKTIVFSTARGFYSRKLGRQISDGDLLTNKGDLVATNQDLVAAFQPRGSNFGLDAAFVRNLSGPNGLDVWFSTAKSFFSEALGTTVGAGDILSNKGQIVAQAADLVAAFKPKGKTDSIGIDSLYVHQEEGSDEVLWFSTNKDFYSNSLRRWIRASDLLASDGTVLMTAKDLTRNFGFVYPICASFQLDAAALASPNVPPNPPPKPPPVPEPTTLALMLIAGLLGIKRRAS